MSNIIKTPSILSGELQFCPITLPVEYAKNWNENSQDFVGLTINGELVNNSLYRIGGLESIRIYKPLSQYLTEKKAEYILILKHIEAYWEDSITKDPKRKPHLESRWVILDKNGVEKKVFDKGIYSPYLAGGVVYSLNSHYYNIETGEYYGHAYNKIKSDNYIFLENAYGDNKSGVLKINKKDGTSELFQ